MTIAVPDPLLQTVLVPAVFAVICYLLSIRWGRKVGWLAFLSLVYPAVLLVLTEAQALGQGGFPPLELYSWAPTAGLTFGFVADDLSLPVALIISLVLAAAAVYSIRYMEKRLESLPAGAVNRQFGYYYLSYLLVSTGLLGIVLSTNLIELYLFLELVLIPTFVIISLFGYVQKERVAITYIIWNQLGAFIFLAGILLAYSRTGSFAISSLVAIGTDSTAYWVVGLILLGWLVKMAVFGLHMWLPVTEAEPPTSFAPIMAIVSGVGTYVIARLLLQGTPQVFQAFSLPLMAWAVITMFYGGAVTLAQNDTKYLFAWSTVSQNSYSILALASWSVLGVAGGAFFFLSQIMGKFVMFAVAGILLTQTGLRDIKQMGGLASKMPLTASLFLIGGLILSAVPPTSGFQAEWIMFAGIFTSGAAGSATYMAVAVLGLIATLLTVAYTLWPVKRIFFGKVPSALEGVTDAPLSMTLPLLAIVIIAILIGIYPDVVSKFLIGFANPLHIGGQIPG
jgi:formate hydrogenlyase subunit 3/multisubunit Na+/H+ antiporter MnhD subunit